MEVSLFRNPKIRKMSCCPCISRCIVRFQAAFGIGDAASKKIDEDEEEKKGLLGDGVDEEEVGTNHTVDSSPAAAFQSEARIRKFMKDIEETTSKGDGESNVPRIDKKIDKMQQDLGDFIDELESGNIYAGDEDEFATNEEIGGQFDEDLENEINETFFDTDKKEVEEEDPDAVIDDI